MYRIIKNELIKIFSKKSLYIILLIAFLIIFFSNFFEVENQRSVENPYALHYNNALDIKSTADLETNDGIEKYISGQTMIDVYKMIMDRYGINSWQEYVTIKIENSKIFEVLYNYKYINNVERYNKENNTNIVISEDKEEIKKEYDNIIKLLDSNSWKEIASLLKKDFESQLFENNNVNSSIKLNIEEIDLRLKYDINFGYDYLNLAIEDYKISKENLSEFEMKKDLSYQEEIQRNELKEKLKTSEYIIKTKNDINNINTASYQISNMFSLDNKQIYIVFICIIILSGIVSDEYNKGTIRKLLIKPYNRGKILFGKFMAAIITMLIISLIISSMVVIIECLRYGINTLNTQSIIYDFNNDRIIEMNIFSYLGLQFLMKLPMFIGMIIILLFISTIFGSSIITMALGFIIYFGGNTIINNPTILPEIAKLLPNCNWDFSIYVFGKLPKIEGMNIEISMIICLVYYLILLIPTFIWFKNGDIKNK